MRNEIENGNVDIRGNDGGSYVTMLNLNTGDGGTATFSSDLIIPDKIVHSGDTNTAIRFPGNDIVTIETGGSERVRVDSAGLKIEDKLLHMGDIDTAIRFPAADTVSFETAGSERLRITSGGRVLIGTTSELSFNGVGQYHNLIVAGDWNDTDITDNSHAAITISNTDGTANNTAGLHFAREDTDGAPHYDGASIVAQFLESMNTGQYPKQI